jgi:sugar phosphate isomerase/epimerase
MKIGTSIHSKDIEKYASTLFQHPILEIEDYLFAGFADEDQIILPRILKDLTGYSGEVLVSGPYIDLNPGSPERLVVEACERRFNQTFLFAQAVHASEVIFLSTFIPIIRLSYYERDWVDRSVKFWKRFLEISNLGIKVVLTNTFEYDPEWLIEIAERVGSPSFRLGFDLGHFLIYSKIKLDRWLLQIKPYCTTVYVHSNNGQIDTHEEPFQGVLSQSMMKTTSAVLDPKAKFLVKSNQKENLTQSIAWIRACIS